MLTFFRGAHGAAITIIISEDPLLPLSYEGKAIAKLTMPYCLQAIAKLMEAIRAPGPVGKRKTVVPIFSPRPTCWPALRAGQRAAGPRLSPGPSGGPSRGSRRISTLFSEARNPYLEGPDFEVVRKMAPRRRPELARLSTGAFRQRRSSCDNERSRYFDVWGPNGHVKFANLGLESSL